jgi:hypothetical protein
LTEIGEASTSGNTISEEIYIESDDENPSHISYDLTKKNMGPIIEIEKDIENDKHNLVFNLKKRFLRNVRNSKRRNP